MNLKNARQIVKRLRKAGVLAVIRHDAVACKRHNPNISHMHGSYVVQESGVAIGQNEQRLFWK